MLITMSIEVIFFINATLIMFYLKQFEDKEDILYFQL